MNWQNIKRNRCPKCGKEILEVNVTMIGGMIPDRIIWHRPCDFQIPESKYVEVFKTKLTPEYIRQLDTEFI